MNVLDRFLVKALPLTPKPVVRFVARQYVAGETIADAMARVRELNAWGAMTTIDVLGEFITEIGESYAARDAYLEVLDEIKKLGVDSNVSVKLTSFGLGLDPEICYANIRTVVARARERGNFVRIDMEDSPYTTKTLDVYRRLRREGFDNVGVVLQAYMRRTAADVLDLRDLRPSYRLCKGIYVEPQEVAYKGKDEIRRNYMAVLESMLAGGSYVGIATHDRHLVDEARRLVAKLGLSKSQYEFQMLLGVEEALGRELVAQGHRLRIYVPFGRDWYGYCMRRLKENPRIARYVLFGFFKRS
jgi:proline dehydrogenase